jgi:hypothetical protein
VELPNCFFDLDSAALASVSGLFGRGGTYKKTRNSQNETCTLKQSGCTIPTVTTVMGYKQPFALKILQKYRRNFYLSKYHY